MEIIPSIDVSRGRCVKRVRGADGTGLVLGDPLEQALEWMRLGARRLHVVDLDGAAEGRPMNSDTVEMILKKVSIPIQVGGGIRTPEIALSYIKKGASWIIVGTLALESSKLLEKIIENVGKQRVIIALDYDEKGRLIYRGWKESTNLSIFKQVERLDQYKPAAFLCTYTPVEGTMRGADVETMKRLVEEVETPIIYAGGVRSIDDLLALKEVGVHGVVAGMALYLGEINFKEALQACG